jgi:hypothetical protein
MGLVIPFFMTLAETEIRFGEFCYERGFRNADVADCVICFPKFGLESDLDLVCASRAWPEIKVLNASIVLWRVSIMGDTRKRSGGTKMVIFLASETPLGVNGRFGDEYWRSMPCKSAILRDCAMWYSMCYAIVERFTVTQDSDDSFVRR